MEFYIFVAPTIIYTPSPLYMLLRSLQEKLNNTNAPKAILALDGGGVKGALTLGYLEKIEGLIRSKNNSPNAVLADYYDLIGGTSTGSIIACLLALGHPVADIIALYQTLGKEVFGKRNWHIIPRNWTNIRALLKSTYRSSTLEKLLREHLKEIELGDQQQIKTGLSIISKRADTFSLWTICNHPGGMYHGCNKNIKLWELCMASTAAPYYFPPKLLTLHSRKNEAFKATFIDGGVSLANNPAMQLFLATIIPSFGFQWPLGEDKITITSVGTGKGLIKESAEAIINRKAISWASKIPELFMTDALEMNQVLMYLTGKNETRLEIVDSQYQDLKDIQSTFKKSFTFSRFNVLLTVEALQKLGMSFTLKQVNSLVEMDHHENINTLLEIGRMAAKDITLEQLPRHF